MPAHCEFRESRMMTAAIALALALPATVNSATLFALRDNRLELLTRGPGFAGSPSVDRDQAGTKLVIAGRMSDGKSRVEIVSTNGRKFDTFACGRPIIQDQGALVCCVTNHRALKFANGYEIQIVFTNQRPARFEFSHGGGWFFLDLPPKAAAEVTAWRPTPQPIPFLTPGATNTGSYDPAWVGVFRSVEPNAPLFRLPNDFFASRIFLTSTSQILVSGFKFVFGARGHSGRPPLESDIACALIFQRTPAGYTLERQIDLSKFAGVVDVDSTAGTLLVQDKADMDPRWGILDPNSGTYRPVGVAAAWGFFLEPALARHLQDILK